MQVKLMRKMKINEDTMRKWKKFLFYKKTKLKCTLKTFEFRKYLKKIQAMLDNQQYFPWYVGLSVYNSIIS